MSQNTHGHGQPRDVCIVVNRSIDSTAGTSSGIDSMKSSGRLSLSGKGHWSRSRSSGRDGFWITWPSFAHVTPVTCRGIVETRQQVEQQLLAVAAADEVHFGTLPLDERGIEGGEDAAEGQLHLRVRRANLAGEHLRVRIAGRTEETQADQDRLAPPDLAR